MSKTGWRMVGAGNPWWRQGASLGAAALALWMGMGTSRPASAEEKKAAAGQDPLSKFSDENLADVGFCFEKFVVNDLPESAKLFVIFS